MRFAHLPSNFGHKLAEKVREFGTGLNTIHGAVSLLLLTAVSVGMWYVIALAYQEVTHSYGVDALQIPVSQLLIVILASMVGSILQLPAVGGGSQVATITILSHVFDVPPEMAASCGILLWLVTFAAVVPVGLLLAHQERLSLRKLSVESHHAEESDLPVS
jgi:peptidoglycan biosynthesis protein MviN/MurJ (putative lipid II flippase)